MSVAMVLAGGSSDKGGIDRVTEYMYREFLRLDPDMRVQIHYSRVGRAGGLLHLSVVPSLLKLTRKLVNREVDIVHLNVAPRGSTFRKLLFLLTAKALGGRVVLQLHGSGFNEFYMRQNRIPKWVVRRFFHSADLVIVLGEFWKAFVADEIGVNPRRVVEISNGVPDPHLRARPASEPAKIVFAGSLGERKGVDVLLHALAKLHEDGASFVCDILGDGELEKYRKLSDELGLAEKVVFHGWQDMKGVRNAMAESSIFVLPSRAENQPVAILEAMAIGLPVVASRIGAIPEQVVDGETGLLVEPANINALYVALSQLVRSAGMRTEFGGRGRDRWQEHFSIEANAKLLIEAYRSLRPIGSQ